MAEGVGHFPRKCDNLSFDTQLHIVLVIFSCQLGTT